MIRHNFSSGGKPDQKLHNLVPNTTAAATNNSESNNKKGIIVDVFAEPYCNNEIFKPIFLADKL